MNKNEVDKFERLCGQLASVYEEISLLSKKKPNDALNNFKLKLINKLLDECNQFLSEKYRPFNDFYSFNEDDIPQNSDAVFILSQYLQCFEKLRSDNAFIEFGTWYWRVYGSEGDKVDEDGMIKIRTIKPKRLQE